MQRQYFIILLLLLSISAFATRNHNTLPSIFSGTMMPYDLGQETPEPVWPDSLKPIYVAHVARHGARYISSPKKLERLQAAIAKASATGTLTKKGRKFKALLKNVEDATGDKWGRLSETGCYEEVRLAQDLYRLLPDLMKKAHVNAISTYVPRVTMTMYQFCHELTALSSGIRITASEGKQFSYLLRCFTADTIYAAYRDKGNWREVSERLMDSIVSPEPAKSILGPCQDLTDRQLRKLTLDIYDILQSLTAFGMPAPTDEFMSESDYRACWEVDNLEHYLRNTVTPLSSLAGKATSPLLARIIADADASLGSRLIDRTMKDAAMDTTDIAEASDANFYFGHAETLMPLLSLMRIPGCFDDSDDYATLSNRWKDYETVPLGANLDIILFESGKGNIYTAVRHNGTFVPPMEGNDRLIISWSDYKAYLIGLIMNQEHTRH